MEASLVLPAILILITVLCVWVLLGRKEGRKEGVGYCGRAGEGGGGGKPCLVGMLREGGY